jgi:hypothetical protein
MKSALRERIVPFAIAALLFGGAAAAIAWLAFADGLPKGPVPIVWDREACAHCKMHIGEPAFAAQLQLRDGQVHNFDDPGCLALYLDLNNAPVHAVYFQHSREMRWLTKDATGFVTASPTPMGFGYRAVAATEPGAISFDAFRALVRNKRRTP